VQNLWPKMNANCGDSNCLKIKIAFLMHNICLVCIFVDFFFLFVFVLRRMQLKDNKCVDMDLDLRILLQ